MSWRCGTKKTTKKREECQFKWELTCNSLLAFIKNKVEFHTDKARFDCRLENSVMQFLCFDPLSAYCISNCWSVLLWVPKIFGTHLAKQADGEIPSIPCCLFCSHSIIFWVKKLPLDPPLTAKVAVRCYCQRFCRQPSSMIFSLPSKHTV